MTFLCGGAKRWSSTSSNPAKVAAAKSYLDSWVGNNSNTTENVRTATFSQLLISGTSYMLATLRLERTDTPASIAQRLKEYAQPIKSQWKCPIVLDLRAWAPDGSPHYKAPPKGSLLHAVTLLDSYGLAVVGVNGTPKELELEASRDLGLPNLWTANRPTALKCGLEDVIQMVARRHREQPVETDDMPKPARSNVEPASSEEDTSSIRKNPTQTDSAKHIEDSPDDVCTDAETISAQFPPISPSATIYRGSVRSGQQVSSEKGRSLLILGSVSSGGEVLSDGDILVLGKLRGRALAGLSSGSARIIATCMDPELVSVGGVLSTGDQISATGGAAMVSLDSQRQLAFEEISMT
jgi:septum site-determining protein MinC